MGGTRVAERFVLPQLGHAYCASAIDVDGVLLVELLLKLVQQPVAHVGDLQAYIPKIESCEDGKQIIELRDQYVGVSFDGTTRLGEAICATLRRRTSLSE